MKKNSTSQSAPARHHLGEGGFFNLRVLIGLFVILAGVFLALLGFGAFSAQAQQSHTIITRSTDPLVPAGFDCSRIRELGIDKQENMRAGAIMIACGRAQGGSVSSAFGAFVQAIKKLLAPLVYGTADVDLITGTESSPNVTQSETFTASNPDNPNQIVVAYNDSRGRNVSPINISGASVSTDGGATFTRLTAANGQSPFSNTVGDPVILYNRPTGTWFTVWLDGGCGGQGLGGYKTTTPWIANSWTHYCIHSNNNDDRSLAGPTTIHLLHSTDGCTSHGTILTLAVVPSFSAIPLTTVSPGPMRDRSRPERPSSATSRLPATSPRAMFTSPA
jgi:hypothetical protein